MSAELIREQHNGRFAIHSRSTPGTALAPQSDALQATVEDFLHGSLHGFGFDVTPEAIEAHSAALVAALVDSHSSA